MFKCRIACVMLAVVSLAGLGITLYAAENPSVSAAYFFACTCVVALACNAVISVLEMKKAGKELRRKIEEEKKAAERERRAEKKQKG
ncbi:MAG: hypothetical protein IKV57_05005 [Clostridia bacterium]|nr:hypothetical protein [Clostridia bacterium]